MESEKHINYFAARILGSIRITSKHIIGKTSTQKYNNVNKIEEGKR